jgi:hypothetical protein
MALLAKLYDSGRGAERHALDADATLRAEDQVPVDVLVADLSTTGCLFVCAAPLAPGSEVTIGIAGVGRREATVVRALEQRYGCEFAVPLTPAEFAAAQNAPGGTIVNFPAWSPGASASDVDAPTAARLPGAVRLTVLAGVTAITWSAIIGVLAWLH